MQQEVVLALLAKEPSHGYELRARLRQALGPLGDTMNDGQVYVTLTRLERAGLVAALPEQDRSRPYQITPAGREQLRERLSEAARIAAMYLRPSGESTGAHAS